MSKEHDILIKSLYARIAELEKEREAVIAKIKEDLRDAESTFKESAELDMGCWNYMRACRSHLKFIRNPKEAEDERPKE